MRAEVFIRNLFLYRGDIHITLARWGEGGVPGLLTDANRGGGGV